MPFISYAENEPIIQGFVENLQNDSPVRGSYRAELDMRKLYSGFTIEDHKKMFGLLIEKTGEEANYPYGPGYTFIIDRLSCFFDIFDRKEGKGVKHNEIEGMADGMVELAKTYNSASSKAYESMKNKRYPLVLLNGIVSWLDLPNSGNVGEKPSAHIDDMATHKYCMENAFEEIRNNCGLDAKGFIISEKGIVGSNIIGLINSELRRNPLAYPFRGIKERGAWSPDYFTDGYVEKDGFSPHQNAIMQHMKDEKTGTRPLCRIERDEGNEFWLIKLDFGRDGYNPED